MDLSLHLKYTAALSLLLGMGNFSIANADATKPADSAKTKEVMPTPWLTGPLLTPSGHVVPNGHFNYEPYFYVTTNFGAFNNHWRPKTGKSVYNLISQTSIQIGMPWNMDFQFVPQFSWNHTHGASSWALNDMNFGFDYQFLADDQVHWWPAIKLQLRANFPMGKYQKLNPNKMGMDIGGAGSWAPGLGLVFSRLFWFGGNQFLALRGNVEYTFETPVHVKNYNAYGGGHHTRGKVFPGQNLQCLIGMEYTWTQNWAVALDIDYTHVNKTRFKGHKGKTKGVPNVVTSPSSEQFSLAPAFEYNFTYNVGLIAGTWFTVAGRNAIEFASGIIAINIYQ